MTCWNKKKKIICRSLQHISSIQGEKEIDVHERDLIKAK